MKKLIGLLLLLGAVFAGSPFVSGMLVEQRYQELLAEGAFASSVVLRGESYERGWFSSTIVTQVEITEPQIAAAYAQYKAKADEAAGISGGDSQPMFRVASVIHHGPAWLDGGFGMGLARVDSRLLLDDAQRAEMTSVFEGEALSMRTTVHFGRSAELELNSSKGTLTKAGANNETAVLQPLTSSWLMTDLGNRVKGEISWPGMDVSGGEQELHISNAVIRTSMERRDELWVGDLAWDQEGIQFDGPGNRVVLKGLHMDTRSGADAGGELVDGVANVTLQSANVAAEAYGPGVYRMSLANFPLTTLVKIQKLQDEMTRAAAGDPTGREAAAASRQILMLLPELLSRGPAIEISELKMVTPQGEVSGKLKISLPESAPEMLMSPQYLKQIIRADAELTVPAAYFNGPQAAQATDSFTQSGFIERNGDMLHSTLHMADGQLTINGKPVPLPF